MRVLIAEALECVVTRIPFEKITVADIAEEAQISRTTFYRYFKDRNDVVDWMYNQAFAQRVAARGLKLDERYVTQWRQIGECVFEAVQGKPEFYRAVIRYTGQNSFLKTFVDNNIMRNLRVVEPRRRLADDPLDLKYSVCFYFAGVGQLLRQWIEDGMPVSPAKLQRTCERCMPDSLRECFESLAKDGIGN